MQTPALLTRAFGRLVPGLAALLLGLMVPVPSVAQGCTSDPRPSIYVVKAIATIHNDSGLTRGFIDAVDHTVGTELAHALSGGRANVLREADFANMLERARLQMTLGTDTVANSILLNEVVPNSALEWRVVIRLWNVGLQRQMQLTLFDATRQNRLDRSRVSALPSDDAAVPALVVAQVRAFAQGLDCSLRLQRGAPVQPQVRLAVEPVPPRGQPGGTLTVRATLVDLANSAAPVPNQRITVHYLTPQGERRSRWATTDANGVATDNFLLGDAHPRAGLIQAAFVDLRGVERKSQQINYYVRPAGGQLNLSTGKAQLAPTGGDTVSAELRHNGNPVPSTAINLSASAGAVGSASVITGSAGRAAVPYVAPTTPSLVDVRATATLPASAGTASSSVSYVVDPGVVMGLAAAGDTVVFGASSLRVDLEREQRAVAGATVEFSVVGGGTLSSATATTDSVGRAEVLFAAPSRAGASTITARVTLDGQTYTRNVTVRYTDPFDAITREMADVKEALYLDPSDATLSRLDRLRSILQARGEGARYEAMLGDTVLVRNQLFCTHQRAHDECAAGARSRGETTLGLLKSATAGSSVASEVFHRSRKSLYRCPYPMFSNERSVFNETATINDIGGPPTYQFPIPVHFFLSLALNDDGSVKGMSWSADDPTNPRRFAYGFVPSTATGPTWTGRSTAINVEGLYGSYFMATQYQASASSSTASFTVNNTAASGFIDLYQVSIDNVPYTATVRFQANITLPAPPSPTMCNHASLPRIELDSAPPRPTARR